MKTISFSLGLAAGFVLAGCNNPTTETASPETAIARPAISTSLHLVRAMPFPVTYSADAEITASSGLVAVVANTPGILETAPPAVGVPVLEGSVLARLDSRDLNDRVQQARLELERVAAQLTVARESLREAEQLSAQEFISKNALRTSRLNADALELQYASAKLAHESAQRLAGYAVITAPVTGVIVSRQVTPGRHVAAGTVVAELLPSELGEAAELAITLPERLHAAVGSDTRVLLDGGPAVTVSRKESWINNNRTFKVFAPLPSELAPVIGRTLRVSVEMTGRTAVAVPEGALVMRGSEAYVFANENGQARQVPVQAGARRQGFVAVEGISENTEIAVSGAAFLREGARLMKEGPQ